jgi:hypothetical protein
LGAWITSSGALQHARKHKTRKGTRITGCTNDIASKNKHVVEEASLNVMGWALDP